MTNLEKAERYDDAYKRLVELCDKRDDLLSQLADVKGKILQQNAKEPLLLRCWKQRHSKPHGRRTMESDFTYGEVADVVLALG